MSSARIYSQFWINSAGIASIPGDLLLLSESTKQIESSYRILCPLANIIFIIIMIAVDFLQAVNILGFASTFPAGVLVQKCGLYITGVVGLIGGSVGNILVWAAGNAHAPGKALIPCFLVAGKAKVHQIN